MRPQTGGRLFSWLFCSLLFGAYIHNKAIRELAMGRDGYLASQSRNFDKVVTLNAHNAWAGIFGALLVLGFAFGVYELIASLIMKFLAPAKPAPESQQLGQGF